MRLPSPSLFQWIFVNFPRWKYCTHLSQFLRSKSFQFSVLGAPPGTACTLPTCGLCLAAACWDRIFCPSTFGASPWRSLYSVGVCPLVGFVLLSFVGIAYRSATTVIMAANTAASFADILAAELDYVIPTNHVTNDKDVQATLASFGAVFNKTRNDAKVAVRGTACGTSRWPGVALHASPRPRTAGRGFNYRSTTNPVHGAGS